MALLPTALTTNPGGTWTVSELTALVKKAVQSGLPSTVQVLGEISNFKRHSSGHLYFTLKDAASELACIMWRSASELLKFQPADGLSVIATGAVDVFERAGRYQLYARKLEPRGVGALELAYRQLCEKLSQEGLFNPEHKRPLPLIPRRIAVVTSPTGAALGDMLRTIRRRFPCVEVWVFAVRVQGPGAAGEIASAIRRVNDHADSDGGIDVMIVGRGGGSLEDLWAFNEEIVARAIFDSRVPVVSAVGHEVDVTIADWVADVRAATPTAAAELVVPVRDELLAGLSAWSARLTRGIGTGVERGHAQLNGWLQRGAFREPRNFVFRREQVVDELSGRLLSSLVTRVLAIRRRVEKLEPMIQRIASQSSLRQATDRLRTGDERIRWAILNRRTLADRRLAGLGQRLERSWPAHRVREGSNSLDRTLGLLETGLRHRLGLLRESVRGREERLSALSYRSVLGRGFSITRTKKEGRVIRSRRQVSDRERVITQLADGEFESEIVHLHQLELFD